MHLYGGLRLKLPCQTVRRLNQLGFTQKMDSGKGTVQPVQVVEPGERNTEPTLVRGVIAGDKDTAMVLSAPRKLTTS